MTTQSSQIRTNNHSSTNGSIITMTLKNNHLIVETEERNDIEEDSRETKVYLPEAKDGVFVVEVQQGSRRSPSSVNTALCAAPDPLEVSVSSLSDQCALVHNPPDRYSDEETLEDGEDSEYCIETASSSNPTEMLVCRMTRTGLTQSNSSLNQPSYTYTTQQAYGLSSYGYAIEASTRSDTKPPIEEDTKPKITAALYKSALKRSPSNEDLHLASMNGVVEKKGENDCCNKKQVNSLNSLVEDINFDVSSGVN
nr:unnamed protein product [Callosobruchus analis]